MQHLLVPCPMLEGQGIQLQRCYVLQLIAALQTCKQTVGLDPRWHGNPSGQDRCKRLSWNAAVPLLPFLIPVCGAFSPRGL